MRCAVCLVVVVCLAVVLASGRPAADPKPPTGYVAPKGYVCVRAATPITVDGRLDDAAWRTAPWTDDFVDIEGDAKPKPRFRTRAKMLWDADYFYIGVEMEEPHVWGTLTQHDAVIFHDNDFEVFVDPDGDSHAYGEFEMNALNTGWDLLLTKPYKDGGLALNSWEIAGLKTAVHVDGTLNDPRDTDRGWSVEIALPWAVLSPLARKKGPPRDGDHWRVNFSRVEWKHVIQEGKYTKVPMTREDNWVWSPQGVIDMHRPETWGYVQFADKPGAVYQPDAAGPTKYALHKVYYAQRAFREKNKRWGRGLAELGLRSLADEGYPVDVATTSALFEASLKAPDGKTWHLRDDGLVWGD